ncbi:GmrSD restriction endonuclease domain-containing protein [Cellulomonas sp. P5_C5]
MRTASDARRLPWRLAPVAGVVGLLAASLVACGAVATVDPVVAPHATVGATPSPSPHPSPSPSIDDQPALAQPQTALAAAALLPVKGRAPKTGYDRDLYGQAWKDVDRNGCDTRNDILRRDLTDQVLKDGTNGCVVVSGTLLDPYSGTPIAFVRGQDTSSAVQIDHVVALSDSWQKGAQQWDTAKREAFGNDPLNLLAADGPLNQQKGDGDAATWLPPNKAFRCAYVARQVGVKYAYGLWVTQAEQDAMVGVLSSCPNEPLPAGSEVSPPVAEVPVTGPFSSCAEAWAAGAAPVRVGDPGYAPTLDGDGDGIGCENRR